MLIIYLFVCLSWQWCAETIAAVQSHPLCTVYTPNSILERKEQFQPLFVGKRQRYATCTGVAWFHDNYLAALNLYGRNIITYTFNQSDKTFSKVQEINNSQGARLLNSENLVASPDGTLLAVCSDGPLPGVALYAIDRQTHRIHPEPVFFLPANNLIHNVRFSHDNTYVATTGWDDSASICIYKLLSNEHKVNLQLVYKKANELEGLKPKGINFTRDSKFAVICYSMMLSTQEYALPAKSLLAVYTFNATDGSLGDLVCTIANNSRIETFEDIAFLPNDTAIVLSNQAMDTLVIYPFNPNTGQIDPNFLLLQNPDAQLSFPHGMTVSPDGNYLVVANYGDDKFNLYQID